MPDSPQPSPRDRSRLATGRLTRTLAGLALAATAAFGVAIASGAKHGSGATVESSTTSVANDDSSSEGLDDGFGFAPSQGVLSSSQPPSATSGGS
jgi:hypothetical protein